VREMVFESLRTFRTGRRTSEEAL